MGKTNYLLLLSIVFMLLMASRGKDDAVRPKRSTEARGSSGTRNANGAIGPTGPASFKLN